MKAKRWFFIGFAALLLAALLIPAAIGCGPSTPSTPSTPEVYDIILAAGTTTSSSFAQGIAYSTVINKYAPGVRVDQISIPATNPKIVLMGKGEVDFASQVSYESVAWAYNGMMDYEGAPLKNLRIMNFSAENADYISVREDSGVTKISDLEGKGFAPGATGTSAFAIISAMLENAGVNADIFNGSYQDIVTAMKDDRIVGYGKTAAGLQLDATMLDVQSFTPLTVMQFEKEGVDELLVGLPGVLNVHVPAGAINALPDLPEFWSPGIVQLVILTDAVPQEIGYQMVKAVMENWDEVIQTYTFGATITIHPIKYTIDNLAIAEGAVPLAAGVVQYAKELGYDVPENLIPPEYTP
ncbi:TAXI family TRAP transporter solute-binding subunit [Chloroflexota bacterium]